MLHEFSVTLRVKAIGTNQSLLGTPGRMTHVLFLSLATEKSFHYC